MEISAPDKKGVLRIIQRQFSIFLNKTYVMIPNKNKKGVLRIIQRQFSIFLNKTYVMIPNKNHLGDMVLMRGSQCMFLWKNKESLSLNYPCYPFLPGALEIQQYVH